MSAGIYYCIMSISESFIAEIMPPDLMTSSLSGARRNHMPINCCICGNKIGAFDIDFPLSETYQHFKVCKKCFINLSALSSARGDKLQELRGYFDKQISGGLVDIKAKNAVLETIDTSIHLEETLVQERRQEEEKKRLIREQTGTFLMTSGPVFENYSIIQYHRFIFASASRSLGFVNVVTALINDDRPSADTIELENIMDFVKERALERLVAQTLELGGNAITGLSFNYITLEGIVGASASGNAVTVVKK